MPKNANQKLKILYIKDYLERNSDETHNVTTAELIAHLDRNGISAERKSIYSDIALLQEYGVDVITTKGKQSGYYIASREFEVSELKLLVDAVASAKFLSERKAADIVKKLSSFCSKYEANSLKRSVYVLNRVGEHSERVFYNVDALHKAISENKNVSFVYHEWKLDYSSEEKVTLRPKRSGERYEVSPCTMMWDDEKYYLIAYEGEDLKSFRVDKMKSILLAEKEDGGTKYAPFDVENYRKETFNMFNGEEESVTLCFHNSLVGIVVDRFGKNQIIFKHDEDHFRVTVKANISPQFYAFLFAYSDKVRILSPDSVIEEYCRRVESVAKLYK